MSTGYVLKGVDFRTAVIPSLLSGQALSAAKDDRWRAAAKVALALQTETDAGIFLPRFFAVSSAIG